jgi:hypothetical protein
VSVVVPFFEEHPPVTAKRADFEAFASVLRMMQGGRISTKTASTGSPLSQSG